MASPKIYGHWHQPYRPPWWRVIRRWKLARRRVYVTGTLKTIGDDGGRTGPHSAA